MPMNQNSQNKIVFLALVAIVILFVYFFIMPNVFIIFWVIVGILILLFIIWVVNRIFIAQGPTGKGNTWFGKK
jgi:hypothetical protein